MVIRTSQENYLLAKGVLGVFGGAVALLSAGLSACAIFPNTATGLNPEALLVGYAAEPESHTRFRALSTLTAVFQAEEQTIQWKARLLRIATVLLPAAGAFLLVGGILGV